jgi:hypothetical protein
MYRITAMAPKINVLFIFPGYWSFGMGNIAAILIQRRKIDNSMICSVKKSHIITVYDRFLYAVMERYHQEIGAKGLYSYK